MQWSGIMTIISPSQLSVKLFDFMWESLRLRRVSGLYLNLLCV